MLNDGTRRISPQGYRPEQVTALKTFLRGSVWCWVQLKGDAPFAARDLVGGDSAHWRGIPLMALYEKHILDGRSDAEAKRQGGIDLGHFLKQVIDEDHRSFESCDMGRAKGYRLASV